MPPSYDDWKADVANRGGSATSDPDEPSDFEAGYDQAIVEVLDEVCERDPDMAEAIVRKFPAWARICSHREGGAT